MIKFNLIIYLSVIFIRTIHCNPFILIVDAPDSAITTDGVYTVSSAFLTRHVARWTHYIAAGVTVLVQDGQARHGRSHLSSLAGLPV